MICHRICCFAIDPLRNDYQQIVRLITSRYFTLMIAVTYHEGNVIDFNVVQRPSSEEFDFRHRFSHPWIYVSFTVTGDKHQSINHHLTALSPCQAGVMLQPHKKPQAILRTQKILKSQIWKTIIFPQRAEGDFFWGFSPGFFFVVFLRFYVRSLLLSAAVIYTSRSSSAVCAELS